MSGNPTSVYDEVPFPSLPYALTHPNRLGAIARLCGVSPQPGESCRVLELGCGAGGNLLPMAAHAPHSSFLGVDQSEGQIEEGRALAVRAELTNVQLEVADLLAWSPTGPPFDYVIAHGVFSWTTAEARTRILQLCRSCLAPTGIACINFNTYPAWHLQGMLREMLGFAPEPAASPAERVANARRVMRFLRQTLPTTGSPYGQQLRAEMEHLERQSDAYLFHAYLNVVNQPFTLSEFRELVERQGLRLLGDADPALTWPELASPHWYAPLRDACADPNQWTQLADFARCTASRRAVVCLAETPAERGPSWSHLLELHLSSRLKPVPGLASRGEWLTPEGQRISGVSAGCDRALRLLADQAPGSIPAAALNLALPRGEQGARPDNERDWPILLQAWCQQWVTVTASPVPGVVGVPARPLATALARAQAATGEIVANIRHQPIRVSAADRQILALADGSRSIDELATKLGRDCVASVRTLVEHGLLQEGP